MMRRLSSLGVVAIAPGRQVGGAGAVYFGILHSCAFPRLRVKVRGNRRGEYCVICGSVLTLAQPVTRTTTNSPGDPRRNARTVPPRRRDGGVTSHAPANNPGWRAADGLRHTQPGSQWYGGETE